MTLREAYLKLETNYINMAFSPKPDALEWCFFLSILGFVASVLFCFTFGFSFLLPAALFIVSGVEALWERSSQE